MDTCSPHNSPFLQFESGWWEGLVKALVSEGCFITTHVCFCMKSIETDVNAKKPEKADMTRDDLEICQDHLEATVASEPTPKGLCIRSQGGPKTIHDIL